MSGRGRALLARAAGAWELRLPSRFDLALALVLTVVGVFGTMGTDAISRADEPVDELAIALVVAGAVTAAFRRRAPVPALALIGVLTSTYLLLAYPYGPVFFPFFVAVYSVAAYRPLAVALPAALVTLVVLLLHLFTDPAAISGFGGVVPGTAWVVVPFAIGVAVRLSREARQRDQAEAVLEERLRIAREVHDVVGHALSAIKVQADVALHIMAQKPEQAEVALTAISRASTGALDEVRTALGVVRRTDPAPAPSLDHVDGLRARMADAGMKVDLAVTGGPRELPAAVDLAGYRVVQESLTNALRHGEDKTATVRVAYDVEGLVIEVSNPALGATAEPGGFGIRGMAERVIALGGEFSAGPTVDGRFEVRAAIPCR